VGRWVDGCKRDAETRNKKNFIKTPQSKFRKTTNPEFRIYGKLSHLNLPLCESYLCSVVVVVVWRRRKRTYAEAPTAKQESMRERCEEEECVAFVISNKKTPQK
jgi:hypothetical protein